MIENLSLAFGIVFNLKEYIFFTIKYMVDGFRFVDSAQISLLVDNNKTFKF